MISKRSNIKNAVKKPIKLNFRETKRQPLVRPPIFLFLVIYNNNYLEPLLPHQNSEDIFSTTTRRNN